MNSLQSKKLKRLKKVSPVEGWDDDFHVKSLIPESLPDDLSDDDLYEKFYSCMGMHTEEEGSRLKISFSSSYYFGDLKDKHFATLTWKGEIDKRGRYVSLNQILSPVVEWLVADGLDYLYAGRFEDAILTFSLERKLREFNTVFVGFPSNACIWLALGMVYMLKNPEQSFKCIKRAQESFRNSKQFFPALTIDIERISTLLNNPVDIKMDQILDKLSGIVIKISSLPENLKQNRQILKEINKTMRKTLPEVESRVKKQLIEEKELEYKIYTNERIFPASKQKTKDLRDKRANFGLFIEANRTEVLIFGKLVDGLKKAFMQYNMLVYFLKRKGVGGKYKEIFDNVWKPEGAIVESEEGVVKQATYRLNNFLRKYKLGEITRKNKVYRLPRDLKFCLIEEKFKIESSVSEF